MGRRIIKLQIIDYGMIISWIYQAANWYTVKRYLCPVVMRHNLRISSNVILEPKLLGMIFV